MLGKILHQPMDLERIARSNFQSAQEKFSRWLKSARVKDEDLRIALSLVGRGGHAERILWSDMPARFMTSKLFAALMVRHQAVAPVNRTYYFITLIDDCGTTSDRLPNLAIDPLTQKVRRAIASLHLNAVVMLEIDPLINYPGGGGGRSLLLHAHALAWTDAPFDLKAASRSLNSSSAWTCSLGARPYDITPIDRTPEDMERVAYYISKQAPGAKNLMPSKKKPGRMVMMSTIEGYRDGLACRLLEGQSQVELMSVMFGVGRDGSAVRQAIRAELAQWHNARPSKLIVPKGFDVWAFWLKIRKDNTRSGYLPYRFKGGAYGPVVTLPPPSQAINILTTPPRSPHVVSAAPRASQLSGRRPGL